MGGRTLTPAELWAEGRHHGFPPCCIARFIFDPVRILPGGRALGRVLRLTPRRAVSDGMVPCEYHLAHYLLTGDRARWRRRRTAPMEACCETRAYFEREGDLVFERGAEVSNPETGEVQARLDLWMVKEVGAIHYCPWCGKELP